MRAKAHECEMAFRHPVASDLFHLVINFLELSLRNFFLLSANTTYHVMMLMARQFILQFTISSVSGTNEVVLRQKFKRAINCWLGQARSGLVNKGIDFSGGKMSTCCVQSVQNCNALRGQAKSFVANLLSEVGRGTGHILIATCCNKNIIHEFQLERTICLKVAI